MEQDRKAIEAVVQTYLDGLHEGDADKLAQAFLLRIADQMAHQCPADASALEVAPHDDGVFASDIIGVRREPSHAEQLVLLLVQRDEGHGAGIVDLGEARVRGHRGGAVSRVRRHDVRRWYLLRQLLILR